MGWRMKCPDDWKVFCSCDLSAIDPDEGCYIHGYPDYRVCPYCGTFKRMGWPCKRCGFKWKTDKDFIKVK